MGFQCEDSSSNQSDTLIQRDKALITTHSVLFTLNRGIHMRSTISIGFHWRFLLVMGLLAANILPGSAEAALLQFLEKPIGVLHDPVSDGMTVYGQRPVLRLTRKDLQ